MKVRLLIRNKFDGEAGEIVEVSPDRAAFLFSVEAAEPVKEAREQAEKPIPTVMEQSEEPKVLKKKPAAKKTTKK